METNDYRAVSVNRFIMALFIFQEHVLTGLCCQCHCEPVLSEMCLYGEKNVCSGATDVF